MNPGVTRHYSTSALTLVLCALTLLPWSPCSALTLLQTVTSEVGAENITYYRLNRPGNLVLQLESVEGDADLYVSDSNLKPTYEDYEAQSVTCGLDIVEIPYYYERPVGIGVFGYFTYDLSKFKLEIYLVSEETDIYENLDENGSSDEYRSESTYEKRIPPPIPKDAEDEESPWWMLLVGILKIILEVLV